MMVGPWYQGIAVPRHDVLALQRGDRHHPRVHLADAGNPEAVALDPLEHLFVVADEIHLVDGDDDVADAEQRDDVGMPSRLHLHAARGVHQDHGEVRSRGAGRHVARVLLVPPGSPRAARRAPLAAVRGHCGELVLEDLLRVVQRHPISVLLPSSTLPR